VPITIYRKRNRAYIRGDIPPSIELELINKYKWIDPEDLTIEVDMYKNKCMYLGMVYDVADYLRKRGFEVEIELSVEYQKEFEWTLTAPYKLLQEDAVNAGIAARYAGIVAPPGVGKTFLAAGTICKLGRKTAVLVPNERPHQQMIGTLERFTNIGDAVGFAGGGQYKAGDVMVIMQPTLAAAYRNGNNQRLTDFYESAPVVIIDEAHKAGARSWLEIIERKKTLDWLIAFSATYHRDDARHDLLMNAVGHPAYKITRGQAIEHKLTAPLTFYIEDMPEYKKTLNRHSGNPYASQKQYDKVYKEYIVNNEYRNRAGLAFLDYMREQDIRHTGVLSVSKIPHIENLCELDSSVVALHGNTPNRQEIFDDLTSQRIYRAATTLMDEAADVPSLSVVAMMAGGKSSIKAEQRIRCDRTFSGITVHGHFTKERGYVYMPYDHAPFLKSHSQANVALYKKIVRESPLHKFIRI
jgi:superfamily II DNA or RNA helicase